jgi:hypothetical protein
LRYDPEYPLPSKIFTTVEVNAHGIISDPNFNSMQTIQQNKMYQQNKQGQIVTFDPYYPLNTKIFTTFETNSSGLIIDPAFDASKTVIANQVFQVQNNGAIIPCPSERSSASRKSTAHQKLYRAVEVDQFGSIVD